MLVQVPTCPAPEQTLELALPDGHLPTSLQPGPVRRVWFVCDVLGIACATSTWLMVLGAAWVMLHELLLPSANALYGLANGALFHLLAILGLASHVRTMLTDPGSVPLGDVPRPGAVSRCPCCGSTRPARAYHCLVCGRCIRKMDHHCLWVNNCVGEDNQKFFVLFTLYVALSSLHLLLLLGGLILRSYQRGEWTMHGTVSPRVSLIFLCLVALKGLVLASVMFATQMYAICADRTRAEQLQRDRVARAKGSKWANLKAVFGHRVSLAWISPFACPEPQRARGHHDAV